MVVPSMRARGLPRSRPQKRGAWSAARRKCVVSLPWRKGSASPCGAPLRDFGRGERASGTGQARHAPRSGWLSPAFILSASSRERQSHVVGPDGDPSLPDATGANRARRRRILLRFMSALEKRPSRTGHAELKRGLERGDSYPHHEMLRAPLFIPGRAFSREPGIHGPVLRCSRFMPPWLSSLPGPEIRSA